MNTNIWQKVDEGFKQHNISGAIEFLEHELSKTDAKKFSCIIGLNFKNTPKKY